MGIINVKRTDATTLFGKTLEFSYYPSTINTSNIDKYVYETIDCRTQGPVSGAKGIDFFQNNSTFKLYSYSSLGNNVAHTLATNIVANKWYRFKIEYIDLGSEEYYYRVSVYDGTTLLGYLDETTLGKFYYGTKNPNNRVLLFFNAHYNYYYGFNNIANTNALLKDVLIYRNESFRQS